MTTPRSRRAYLAAGGGAVAGALAGCLDSLSGGNSSGNGGLTLESLSVAGSPGGPVPVRPEGTVVLLDFFATWCAPCKPQMDELRAVREQFEDDLHMLSITTEDDRDAIEAFWRKYEGTWPVALDPDLEATERFGAKRIPTLLVLAPDGEEVWRHVGLAAADTIETKVREADS